MGHRQKGMLGSHFRRLLKDRSLDFIATGQEINIADEKLVSDFVVKEKPSHIINCAAYTNVDQGESEPQKAERSNSIGPAVLGKISHQNSIKLVHFSTDYVFNGKKNIPYREEDLCAPLGAYGRSKHAGELNLLKENEKACIIRTSWLFGFPGKNFVETILKLLQEKESLRVVSDQLGRPTYCQDLAEAALQLIDQSGIFHFANSSQTSWHAFAEAIREQALLRDLPIKTQKIEAITTAEYPTKAMRPTYSTFDTTKYEQFTKMTPRPWKEALNEYLSQRGIIGV